MDPLTVAVTTILGKYAIDKGATLLKEAGKAAADAAGKLFQKVIDRLKADPTEAKNADRFEKDPVKHQELMSEVLDEKVKTDPNFRTDLSALLQEYKQSGGVEIIGSPIGGDVFMGDSAFKIGGDVDGAIQYGGSNNTINTRGGTNITASQVDINGDVTGRDKKTKQQ